MSGDEFRQALGGVFERSPWVAGRVVDARPFPSVEALHGAMVAAVRRAPREEQLALLCAHPDLAGMAVRGTAAGEPSQKNPKMTDREQRNVAVRGAAAGEPSQKNPKMTDREQRNQERPAGEASVAEQSSAGLDRLTGEEYERFNQLNAAYRGKFGFPFIIAVRQHDKGGILAAFETRLRNTIEQEVDAALTQVATITRLRLDALVVAAR
jgi:2-oxo-4-hydroxy-4-carboxy-5-ureidoimidazoline decarboxylase